MRAVPTAAEAPASAPPAASPTSAPDAGPPRPAGPAAQPPLPPAAMHEDEAMTDDMRIAISALGLMREGSLSGNLSPPAAASALRAPSTSNAPLHADSSAMVAAQAGKMDPYGDVGSAAAPHSRGRSTSRRSDPSRSASNASMASYSDAWTGTAPSEAGDSSLATSMSVSHHSGMGAADAAAVEAAARDGVYGPEAAHAAAEDPHFMARVSQLPIVSGGLEWYERSKAQSKVVKYGADLVESSFSAVSRPITNNLPLGGALDDFACRQLDRIGASPGRRAAAPLPSAESTSADPADERSPSRPPADSAAAEVALAPGEGQLATVHGGPRSRWQTVLLEAGGFGAAVSEESLKSLRYCLQWLLYANAHLDHHIGTLRDFMASLRAQPRVGSGSHNALMAVSASAHLTQIKHDIVETIRKVVDVVSKYAGAALPEQARRYVKQSILGLPVKWASAVEVRAGRRSRESSVGTVSMATETDGATPRPEAAGAAKGPSDGSAPDLYELSPTEDAADRVLTFAVESLDMLRAVTGIFGESVERAEAWIERLRVIGVDRQRQQQDAASPSEDQDMGLEEERPALPTARDGASASALAPQASAGTKRRRASGAWSEENGDRRAEEDRMVDEPEQEEEDGPARRKRA